MFKIFLLILNIFWTIFAFREISSQTLIQWLNGSAPSEFILIDLRDPGEITTVIGSDNCGPYNFSFNSGEFESKVNSFPRDTIIVLYCRSGSRSNRAASRCDTLGFTNTYSLRGGTNSWNGPVLQRDQIKSEVLFPQVQCVSQVSVLPQKKIKSPRLSTTAVDRKINLQGKICGPHASGMLITAEKPLIFIGAKKK